MTCIVLLANQSALHAETIPATTHWGWMKGWGAPWGLCGQNYSFEAANEFGCAPIAEACHPNRGQKYYSPFIGIAGCTILTSTGRVAGAGGSWYTCPDTTWALSGSNCTRGCPEHAHGVPCVCDDGYKFDATGTSCILEPYTLSLSGLGGDVMPAKTRAAYAEVKTSAGSPESGAQVALELTVVPEDDGQLYSAHVGSISPNGGATGADGRLNFVFTAPVAGGLHTVTATCNNCSNTATGTLKVPGCPIADLPPIDPAIQPYEDNPNLSDTANLTDAMRTALQRLQAAVNATGSTPTVGSAYRPPAYNQHLIDVWEKWVYELKDNPEPACTALKSRIHAHFLRHELLESQPPVEGSRHTRGEAVDVTISPVISNIDTLARDCCNLRRPLPVKDPVHFQFP